MALLGMKRPVVAKYSETGGTIAYTVGKVLSKAISADIEIKVAEAILYADDGAAESARQFSSGTITLNVDDLSDENRAFLYGHTQESAGISGDSTTQMLVAKGSDDSPYVGIGFYAKRMVGGVTKYRAVWFTKCKFGVPQESYSTTGDSVEFQTPTTEGTILLDYNGAWKKEVTVTTEAIAQAWLNTQAGIAA